VAAQVEGMVRVPRIWESRPEQRRYHQSSTSAKADRFKKVAAVGADLMGFRCD
jgi:hypothetical protein